MSEHRETLALAFDTANGTIAIGIGRLDASTKSIRTIATAEEHAERSSNTKLMPMVDELFASHGLDRRDMACVAVGVGPGSFTGVRIAVATAKGIASAMGIPLVGLSTLNVVAQGAHSHGVRGELVVIDDAMRKEVYPALFALDDEGIRRITSDRVIKASGFSPSRFAANEGAANGGASSDDARSAGHACDGPDRARSGEPSCPDGPLRIAGDALAKHPSLSAGDDAERIEVLPESLWEPTGQGLLDELQRVWGEGVDVLDVASNDPKSVLPVYTRLSDAEENERARLADDSPRDLRSGVQGKANARAEGEDATDASGVTDAHVAHDCPASLDAPGRPDPADDPDGPVVVRPFDPRLSLAASELESECMKGDAWTPSMLESELSAEGRIWWMALVGERLVGYAGGLVAGDDLEVLKVAVDPAHRRQGIATSLLGRLAEDARNLAARTVSLEVRKGNEPAMRLYSALGFDAIGERPGYYSDGEDAIVMSRAIEGIADVGLGSLRLSGPHVLRDDRREGRAQERPLILAIESSCDETAASVVDGSHGVLSDVVASQVDFHARFGGVVPEIASRKHIEAIAGVAELALRDAAGGPLLWEDLDAMAVTYAPGLIGALVIGVAFAKGASWALDIPLIAVNHLEGHLYANELDPGFSPPAVVSLVSGGNTMLVHMRDKGDYEVLGGTIDDAVGEAFDKVAKAMGLPYPGGPVISELAEGGDPQAVDFPRALMHTKDYRFSLSGLKTAVMVHLDGIRERGEEPDLPDICASFQQAVIDVQVEKARRALRETGAGRLCVGGGVAANPALRRAYEDMCREEGAELSMPPLRACGDNAVMIGLVAQDRFGNGAFEGLGMDAKARTDLSEPY